MYLASHFQPSQNAYFRPELFSNILLPRILAPKRQDPQIDPDGLPRLSITSAIIVLIQSRPLRHKPALRILVAL